MLLLEEAGEEDICALLNQLMELQPYFGTGIDLSEYLAAITLLESQGELQVREYQILNGRTVFLDVLCGEKARCPEAFSFDGEGANWKWNNPIRQMVEVSED